MFDKKLFLIILFVFLVFIIFQVYFYSKMYNKNDKLLKKIESFENTLTNIKKNNEYVLDDSSLEILLEDYKEIKSHI